MPARGRASFKAFPRRAPKKKFDSTSPHTSSPTAGHLHRDTPSPETPSHHQGQPELFPLLPRGSISKHPIEPSLQRLLTAGEGSTYGVYKHTTPPPGQILQLLQDPPTHPLLPPSAPILHSPPAQGHHRELPPVKQASIIHSHLHARSFERTKQSPPIVSAERLGGRVSTPPRS